MTKILVVCGLNREASLASGPDVVTVAGGGARTVLSTRLDGLDPRTIGAVVSFGLAGALAPGLRVGTLVLASAIATTDGSAVETSSELRSLWAETLRPETLDIRQGTMLGVDRPILSAGEKASLAARSGAVAVDMESHIAAAYAARHGLPFGILRVISDGADRTLPDVAGRAMRPDGSVDIWAVLRGLVRKPGDLPPLLTTARDAGRAFAILGRARRRLGPRLGIGLGLRGVDL